MIVDLYAGPRGWSEGLRVLGLADVGIELDPWACRTAVAAGHATIRADVCRFPLRHLAGRVEGLIASPPCQSFSSAGKGDGRRLLGRLVQAVHRGDWAPIDEGGASHVLEVGRWVEALRPEWVACEQVPGVLPVWQAYARRWRAEGFSAWAGVLEAADYGVPQNRTRAILVASQVAPVTAPAPTHCRGGAVTLDGELAPWVSMADALGWVGEDTPARTLCGRLQPRWLYPDPDGTRGRMVLNRRQQNADGSPVPPVPGDRPAPTLTGIAGAKGQWIFERPATGAVRLTLEQALILQSFRPDYPVQGNKTEAFRQVGNAVPPLLAAHVLSAVTGAEMKAAA